MSVFSLLPARPSDESLNAMRRLWAQVKKERLTSPWVLLLLAVAASLALLLFWPDRLVGRADALRHAETGVLVVKQTDARRDTDLLDLEMELADDDDQVTVELSELRAGFAQVDGALGLSGTGELAPGDQVALAELRAQVHAKTDLADHIRSQHAALGHSGTVLLAAAEDLQAAVAASATGPRGRGELEAGIIRLLIGIAGPVRSWDPDMVQRTSGLAAAIRQLCANLAEPVRQKADRLIDDAARVVTQRAAGLELLRRLSGVPVQSSADRLLSIYRAAERDVAGQQAMRTTALFVATGTGLLGLACVVAWRLSNDCRQLKSKARCLEIDYDETQQQLIQSAKMSALGHMVAGVAHEINTPLAYVKATFEVLRDLLTSAMAQAGDAQVFAARMADTRKENAPADPLFSDIASLLTDGVHGVEQITALVRSMRNFSRLDQDKITECSLHDIIDGAVILTHHKAKHTANVEKHYGQVPIIECSPSQINQVVVNLINNAIDAVEHRDHRGVIRIGTSVGEETVMIKVQDNGRGMSKALQKKVFDPFLTTKPVGKGTGLGLSICYRIIQNHGGSISVESAPEMGTTFSVSLPLHRAACERQGALSIAGAL